MVSLSKPKRMEKIKLSTSNIHKWSDDEWMNWPVSVVRADKTIANYHHRNSIYMMDTKIGYVQFAIQLDICWIDKFLVCESTLYENWFDELARCGSVEFGFVLGLVTSCCFLSLFESSLNGYSQAAQNFWCLLYAHLAHQVDVHVVQADNMIHVWKFKM